MNLNNIHQHVQGQIKLCIIDAESQQVVHEYPPINNLITDWGLDQYSVRPWRDLMMRAVATTEYHPTKIVTNSTYSRAGDIVTRQSGSYTFDATDYGAMVLSKSPVAYWPLDDAVTSDGASARDLSGNGYHAVYKGSITARQGQFEYKRINQHLYTSSSYVSCGRPALAQFSATDPFTVSIWFRTTDQNTTNMYILNKSGQVGPGSNAGIRLQVRGDTPRGLWAGNGGPATNYTAQSTFGHVSDLQWRHIAMVSDGATTTLYYGASTAAVFANGAVSEPLVDWIIHGIRTGGTNTNTGFSGPGTDGLHVGHVALFASALSVSDIRDLARINHGDRCKTIKWNSGEEARIVDVTSGTTCTTETSGTITAANATLWRTQESRFITYTAETVVYPEFNMADGKTSTATIYATAAGFVTSDVTLRRTFDFAAPTTTITYSAIGFTPDDTRFGTNLFSIVDISSSAVSATSAQQLRATYELTISCPYVKSAEQEALVSADTFSGMPVVYNIVSAYGNGTHIIVTTSATTHFRAGSAWTVTIAGTTNYNGTYVVAGVTSNMLSAVSTTNLGTDTGGTMYNDTTHRFRTLGIGTMPVTVQSYGRQNNMHESVTFMQPHLPLYGSIIGTHTVTVPPTSTTTPVAYWDVVAGQYYRMGTGNSTAITAQPSTLVLGTNAPYASGSFVRSCAIVLPAANNNVDSWTVLGLYYVNQSYCSGYIQFTQPQTKKSTHTLTLNINRSWSRVLINPS